MSNINNKHGDEYDIIDRIYWDKCLICNKSLQEIKAEIGGSGIYFGESFFKHIKSHNLSLTEYFIKYLKFQPKLCPCGVCNKLLSVGCYNSIIYWRRYACGRYPNTMKWAEKAKQDRKGVGNPMFQKKPWNLGLTKETDSRIKLYGNRVKGKKLSEEHKQKLKDARARHPLKARHCIPHSKATCEILRQNTLRMIRDGILCCGKRTKPHIKMGIILDSMNIKFEEEKLSGYFSFDYYLPDFDIYIEVDGDYWHSNPKFYPNGPETKKQKINYARDCSKNHYCQKNNMMLYRFWEEDIMKNDESIKNQILCITNQLNILKKSV